MKDHCNVFGFNLFDNGGFLDKVMIMGDEDLVREWCEGHESPNCGEDGWECFGAVSEYDYLFVCVDQTSSSYGHTRRIINNCWEDYPLISASFDELFKTVEKFAEEWVLKTRLLKETEDSDDDEACSFLEFC